ncbi:NAD(P)/FAD-dependent oxidoreductase [Sporosarcina siberiensis]|uniref:NAD(P)/FAD-dependent oxidoreductase n=1 Tax=Sporosarcina siberiensis TaxID=1365606 RepID=A0ABW4SIJ4_9BACL
MKQYIIIGAGILGTSAAYQLAKSGVSVTVIDREEPGRATDAAAGIICPWLSQRRNKAWYALAKSGAAYYTSLIEQLKEDGETETGYRQVGAISVQKDAGKLEKMKERAITRRLDAPEIGVIEKLTSTDTSALFPPLLNDFESVYISGAARVNGRALRQALVNAAEKHGALFVKGSAELEYEDSIVTGVRLEKEFYPADCVLVTAGAWASELLKPLGIHLEVSGQKAQIVHLQLSDEVTEEWPVVIPPNDQYILAFDDGKVIVGATHEDGMEFDGRVTAGGLHEVLDKALAVAPGLVDSEFIETRVGFRPITPNFLPIIGEVPNVKGMLLANGLGASGLTVGPFLGEQLAKLVLGQQVEIDLDLYPVSGAIRQD